MDDGLLTTTSQPDALPKLVPENTIVRHLASNSILELRKVDFIDRSSTLSPRICFTDRSALL